MSFNISLTGLRGAQSELSVTGNNLANANTIGFKHSRAEFGDLYAGMMGGGMDRSGMGVKVQRISQEHSQGNFDFTERSLDMAIDGNGYFILNNDGDTEYTRSGFFDVDREGFVINNDGKRLQGYPPGNMGADAALEDLRIPSGLTPQKMTTEAKVEINLDSRENLIDRQAIVLDATGNPELDVDGNPILANPFNPSDSTTYHFARELDVFDSLGNRQKLTKFFTLAERNVDGNQGHNRWEVRFAMNGEAIEETTQITFDENGALLNIEDVVDDNFVYTLPQGVFEGLEEEIDGVFENIEIDFAGMTQYGANSSVISLSQNGYASGSLAGISVSEDGWLMGRYTNGENLRLGQLAVATFINPQGLQEIGSNSWVETPDSGLAAVNPPGVGSSGQVLGGALEQSTVDVSEELVKMLIAQRNFQANSKSIQTQDTLSQTIINLR